MPCISNPPISSGSTRSTPPPEDTPLVLDAESSQRQCVAAALAGGSFVMDGPPGTGKSQTIANIVAALMHAGKSVLFVSEKAVRSTSCATGSPR
nr:AAA family ATPase [Actinomadura flavalba]